MKKSKKRKLKEKLQTLSDTMVTVAISWYAGWLYVSGVLVRSKGRGWMVRGAMGDAEEPYHQLDVEFQVRAVERIWVKGELIMLKGDPRD